MALKKYVRFMLMYLLFTCFIVGISFQLQCYSAFAATGEGTVSTDEVISPVPNYTAGNGQAVILMYHHLVTNEDYNTGKYKGNNAVIPVRQFENQMKYLAEHGYTTITMSELHTYLSQSMPLPKNCVVVTFDDGYESNYLLAFPVLKQYNIKATIAAVVSSSVVASTQGNQNFSGIPHLTFQQMREMINSGLVEIGSHSYDGHGLITSKGTENAKFFLARKYLSDVGRNETESEYYQRITDDLRRSKSVLEQELGVPVTYFAYPYGANSETVQKALQEVGFQTAVTVKAGGVTLSSNPLLLNRKNVDANISLEEYAQLLK